MAQVSRQPLHLDAYPFIPLFLLTQVGSRLSGLTKSSVRVAVSSIELSRKSQVELVPFELN